MNKVITINLGGTAYQLEEGGYDVLRAYLETATARLQGNPDREEILSDIEWAMAEKFRGLLGNHKTVVLTKEVTAVLAEMGPIEAATGATTEATNAGASGGAAPGGAGGAGNTGNTNGPGTAKEDRPAGGGGMPRRLYRIYDGSMISGVCNGIAAYVNVDPTLVRLAFVLLTMFGGAGVLVYIVMAIVIPVAHSPEEKAAASGDPSTAQEFIRRAQAGYYEAMKGFPDRKARREWKRRFKRDMRANAHQWRHQWRQHWYSHPAEPSPAQAGAGFALPFLSVLHGAANVLWICALVSLLSTGAIFGLVLPANVPVWMAVVLLFLVYGIFTWPLKAARHSCYWGLGRCRPVWSFIFLLDAVVWLVVVAILLWLALHFFPQLREAVQGVPALAHQALDDIRTWWK